MRNETVTAIFVTHTHRDHSPAVPGDQARNRRHRLRRRPAPRAARPLHIGEHNPLDASADRDFKPDVALKDGAVIEGDGLALRGDRHARPHRQPHVLRAQGHEHSIRRRIT